MNARLKGFERLRSSVTLHDWIGWRLVSNMALVHLFLGKRVVVAVALLALLAALVVVPSAGAPPPPGGGESTALTAADVVVKPALFKTVPRGVGYPSWLRNRVVLSSGSARERALKHGVSVRSVHRFDGLFGRTGSVERLPSRAGRPPATPAAADMRLRFLTSIAHDVYRSELRAALLALTGWDYKLSTISRRWKNLGFIKKRVRRFSRNRSEDRRVRYWVNPPVGAPGIAGIFGIPTWSFIDIDEAGFELTECDRPFGHALKGQRASMPGWVCFFSFVYWAGDAVL
jgi:hypothetical protein